MIFYLLATVVLFSPLALVTFTITANAKEKAYEFTSRA